MVNCGDIPVSPARVITNGIVEITLLPKLDRTQSATPKVIINNDTMSNKCCHENEIIFSLNEFFRFDVIDSFIEV